MDRVFGYIFSKMRDSEVTLRNTNKALALVAVTGFVSMVIMLKHIEEQDKKLDKLTKELEEMKNKEEE